jgi:AAA domain
MTNGLFPTKRGAEGSVRFAMLLWGPSGAGKTTWAATAPGDKLWLSFDEGEHISVIGRKEQDIFYKDFVGITADEIFKHGYGFSPFGLDKELAERRSIKTVVVDNLTAIQYFALQKSVADGVGASRAFTPTMQQPGIPAYGGRNMNLIGLVRSLLAVTGKHKVNIIFTAHEADPVTRMDKGVETILHITMGLGGQLINGMSGSLSEVWNFRQDAGGKRNRIVTVRVSGNRKPMKTRIFDQRGESSFVVNYDATQPDRAPGQMTITSLWEQWLKNGMSRIPVPSTRKGGDDEDNTPVRFGPHSLK